MTDYYIFNDYLLNMAKPEIIQDMPDKYMPDLIPKIFQQYLDSLIATKASPFARFERCALLPLL